MRKISLQKQSRASRFSRSAVWQAYDHDRELLLGWVASLASLNLDPSSSWEMGPDTEIEEGGRLSGGRLLDRAVIGPRGHLVSGTVYDDAVVNSEVSGEAKVGGKVRDSGSGGKIFGTASLSQNVKILPSARDYSFGGACKFFGDISFDGTFSCGGEARGYGRASVIDARLTGKAVVKGDDQVVGVTLGEDGINTLKDLARFSLVQAGHKNLKGAGRPRLLTPEEVEGQHESARAERRDRYFKELYRVEGKLSGAKDDVSLLTHKTRLSDGGRIVSLLLYTDERGCRQAGGYAESLDNINSDSKNRVLNKAVVDKGARLFGGTTLLNDAYVTDNAKVTASIISGQARVGGRANLEQVRATDSSSFGEGFLAKNSVFTEETEGSGMARVSFSKLSGECHACAGSLVTYSELGGSIVIGGQAEINCSSIEGAFSFLGGVRVNNCTIIGGSRRLYLSGDYQIENMRLDFTGLDLEYLGGQFLDESMFLNLLKIVKKPSA